MAKKHPRDVDCDIVCGAGGPAGGQPRRAAPSPSPPVFVMQIVAPAVPHSLLRALPAATTEIIAKNMHLSAFSHHHNADIPFKETKSIFRINPTFSLCSPDLYEACY